jgi:hypothetical protein
MDFKKLYTFKVDQEASIEEVEISKDDKGEEIKTIKKVKKNIPLEFAIKKPNRVMFEDAELFYGIRLSESIKAGLLPKALVVKRFENDGGALSRQEEARVKELIEKLAIAQKEIFLYETKGEKSRTEIDESNFQSNIGTIQRIRQELIEIERTKSEIFEQTAENRARNKTIMWWVLNLAHKKEGDKFVPFFGEGTYEERLKKYDDIEESENEFLKKILVRFAYLITFWYVGKISTEKDFEEVDLHDIDAVEELNSKIEDLEKEEKQAVELKDKESETGKVSE